MIITLFEQKSFHEWCTNEIHEYKESILYRALNLLSSITNDKKNIKTFATGEEVLFKHLDSLSIYYQTSDEDMGVFNTAIYNRCLTILYDEDFLQELCDKNNIDFLIIQEFLNNLSKCLTDAAVVEWKLQKNIPINYAKISSSRNDSIGFFPISYELQQLICVVQKLSNKNVHFTTKKITSAKIGRQTITVYFEPVDRLDSEYIVALQLLEYYLYLKKFNIEDKYYFINKENWLYDKDTLRIAIGIIMQNRLKNEILHKMYPLYDNEVLYSLLDFKCGEEYMQPTFKYLCKYFSINKMCNGCVGLEGLLNGSECPLINKCQINSIPVVLDEISTHEQYDRFINNILSSIIQ